ncbi:MAG: hypothetical protein E7G18_03860 [Anaerococcus hydrogenalis]|uniref:hypothetical protein n=1 Tax=Anaerococcus hydrogenalis TaxID=33029 RepID=UPI002903EA11|nr:hypothetical protein [Anaerococcus hydrogenalis]MDU3198793.1 hypothetical protein [Anaerococcus hydrogenalis]MDU3687802.1 hypothetical protein [Anaerococcus hydrogenalis]
MDNSNYHHKLKSITRDLSEYIKVIDDNKSLIKFVLSKAKEKKLKISLINDCYYIKNENPKAVLHLNISDKINSSSYIKLIGEQKSEIETNINIIEISGLISIILLLEDGLDSFDILLTNNHFNEYNRDFNKLRSVIRSNNIINLNLNESNCIAESFASYTLSTIEIPIERMEINEKNFLEQNCFYRISLNDVLGNNITSEINNFFNNSTKMLMTFLRKIKSKVDLDVIEIRGGTRFDNNPYISYVDLVCKKEFENDLLDVFKLMVSEYLSTNLRIEPNLKFEIEKIEETKFYPMTQESFNHISSFVELAMNGTFSVDSNTKTTISSSNLAKSTTSSNKLNIVMIFRSLSEDSLQQMIEKTKLACNVNKGKFTNRLMIPSWQNKNNYLAKVFKNAYDYLFKSNIKIIKTQYSLDCNLIFYKFDVNMISIGVKYKQVDIKKSTSDFKDILKTFSLIKEVLFRLDRSLE